MFNQFLYHGTQKIEPGKLMELDTTEIAVPYGEDDAFVPEQRYRDVAKILTVMTDGRAAYCILAVENETKVNYAMPVKDGLYDFMQLAKQVTETAASHKKSQKNDSSTIPDKKSGKDGNSPTSDEYLSGFWKSDRLLPVVTVVIYFGSDEWDGPISLRDMYADCDAEILKYAADYRINLIAPYRLSDEEIDEFVTSFREIMKYIKYSSDGKKLKEAVNADERFKKVERQAVDVINVTTNSKIKYSQKEEAVDMCIAIQEIREEGELIGVIRTYKKMKVSLEDAKKYIMEEYKKSETETDELLKEYWK